MSGSLPREFVELLAIVRGYQRSRAVTVAAELGIADLLSGGPCGVDDLAAETATDASSLYPAARMFGADYQWRAWGALRHSVETGGNAAVHALGMDVWEYRRLHPEH